MFYSRTKLTDSKSDDLRDSRKLTADSTTNEGVQVEADELNLPKALCNTVTNFIQDETVPIILKSLIQCHVQRADSRILGMFALTTIQIQTNSLVSPHTNETATCPFVCMLYARSTQACIHIFSERRRRRCW